MNTFQYQNKRASNYFEGWYVRLVDEDNKINLAVIFAVTTNKENPHSFIQFYNSVDKKSHYFTYSVDDFHYNTSTNTVHIQENYLSVDKLHLDNIEIALDATFSDRVYLEEFKGTNSAMGPMESSPLDCFQEVVFLDGNCNFTIDQTIFKGKAYMEKTYGSTFPTKWVWIESNHSTHGSVFSFSMGKIPLLFFKITGFFLIYRYNDEEVRFTTYNRSKLKIIKMTPDETTFLIRKKRTVIIIKAKLSNPVTLVGPTKKAQMTLDVLESLDGEASIQVYESGKLVFEDEYRHVGIELMFGKK